MKGKSSGWTRRFDGAATAEDLNFRIWGFQLKKKNRKMD